MFYVFRFTGGSQANCRSRSSLGLTCSSQEQRNCFQPNPSCQSTPKGFLSPVWHFFLLSLEGFMRSQQSGLSSSSDLLLMCSCMIVSHGSFIWPQAFKKKIPSFPSPLLFILVGMPPLHFTQRCCLSETVLRIKKIFKKTTTTISTPYFLS